MCRILQNFLKPILNIKIHVFLSTMIDCGVYSGSECTGKAKERVFIDFDLRIIRHRFLRCMISVVHRYASQMVRWKWISI